MIVIVSNVNDTQPAAPARRILAEATGTAFVSLRMETQAFSGSFFLQAGSVVLLALFALF